MERKIEISDETYQRLEALVQGFDSPDSVITRLLDHYEKNLTPTEKTEKTYSRFTQNELDLIFNPSEEEVFKKQLIQKGEAWIYLEYIDGSHKLKNWKIKEFGPTSSLRGNLLSGHLRGWRKKGICHAKIAIKKEHIYGEN